MTEKGKYAEMEGQIHQGGGGLSFLLLKWNHEMTGTSRCIWFWDLCILVPQPFSHSPLILHITHLK